MSSSVILFQKNNSISLASFYLVARRWHLLRRTVLLSRFVQKLYPAYPLPPGIPTRNSTFRVWLGCLMLSLGGWRFEGQFPDEKKLLVAVAPHTSNGVFVGSVSVMLTLRLRLSFMAKSSLFIGLLVGWWKEWAGLPLNAINLMA